MKLQRKPVCPVSAATRRLAETHRLMRWVLPFGFALVLLAGCGQTEAPPAPPPEVKPPDQRVKPEFPVPKVKFRDVTKQSGIAFEHTNGSFGQRLMPETLGSGVAFLDYDNDDKQDLLFVNSRPWPGRADVKSAPPTLKLYRNAGAGKFEDMTKSAGLDVTLYGMGATAGDYDNDGHIDLFVTALGGNRLFHNVAGVNGQRSFEDVTNKSEGLAPKGNWPTGGDFLEREEPIDFPSSAAFFDYDKDGLLDLFVCYYVRWSPKIDLKQGFTLKGGGRTYGPPKYFTGTNCQLLRNQGDGKFVDVSQSAGIHVAGELGEPAGKALGLVVCDADGDGWEDVIVANDTVRNFFFHNQGIGTFKERAEDVSVAYADGTPRGGMGIDWGEYRPGKFAVVIGNFANEPDTLFCLLNRKNLVFSDMAQSEGSGGPSRPTLTFGVFFFDYDLDGRLDLLCSNGHLEPDIAAVQPSQSYKQAPQLFWNTGGKVAFEPVTDTESGPDLFAPMVGRGSAFADLDGDGDLDVVLTANGGSPRLLVNEGGTKHHWVRLVLKGDGKSVNTSAIGASVAVTAGGKTQHRHVASARGYLSQSDLGLTFGLGSADTIDRIEIHWPGKELPPQVLTKVAVDRVHVIEK